MDVYGLVEHCKKVDLRLYRHYLNGTSDEPYLLGYSLDKHKCWFKNLIKGSDDELFESILDKLHVLIDVHDREVSCNKQCVVESLNDRFEVFYKSLPQYSKHVLLIESPCPVRYS